MAETSALKVADLQNALKELECPICFELFKCPIYTCKAGHSICSDCRSKVVECPTCRDSFTDARNFALEKIISLANVRCKYFDYGCKSIVKRDEYDDHISRCSFRMLQCFMCYRGGILLDKFFDHVKFQHREGRQPATLVGSSIKYTLRELDVTKSEMSWPIHYFHYKHFIIFVQRIIRGRILYFTLWQFPFISPGLKCNLKWDIGQNLSGSWVVRVNSIRNSFQDNIKSGTAATVCGDARIANTKPDPTTKIHEFEVNFEIVEK